MNVWKKPGIKLINTQNIYYIQISLPLKVLGRQFKSFCIEKLTNEFIVVGSERKGCLLFKELNMTYSVLNRKLWRKIQECWSGLLQGREGSRVLLKDPCILTVTSPDVHSYCHTGSPAYMLQPSRKDSLVLACEQIPTGKRGFLDALGTYHTVLFITIICNFLPREHLYVLNKKN